MIQIQVNRALGKRRGRTWTRPDGTEVRIASTWMRCPYCEQRFSAGSSAWVYHGHALHLGCYGKAEAEFQRVAAETG